MPVQWRVWAIGPALLGALALGIGATPWLRSNPVVDLGPLDLHRGATHKTTFRAGYSELYAIGLQMDQRTVKRLFPCMADTTWYSEHRADCEQGGALAWPAQLSFSISSRGEDVSDRIEISRSQAGGQYAGEETYTWQPAFIELRRGDQYTLTVRSLADASAISAAHPRLVAEVVSPGFLEELALKSFAAFVAAIGLLIASAAWFVVGWAKARRS